MTRGPGWRKCTAYRQPGPRGTPLGLGLHCCSALARTGQLQALFAPLSRGTGLWPCPTRPASVARSGRNGSPTDEKYMRRSVLRTAAGQAAVAPSRCSSGGWRATAKGNSIALARVKSVQESCGNSNPPWPRPPCRVVPNPSFKPSTNGVSRGPGRRYAVHFRQPGPRATPLVPA